MDPDSFDSLIKSLLENKTFQSGLESLVTNRGVNNSERHGQHNTSNNVTQAEASLAARNCNVTVQDEFRRLFRPGSTFSRPSASTSRLVSRPAQSKYKNAFSNFSKQVIVLDSPSTTKILNQKEMAALHKKNQIKVITFSKSWSESMVKNHIRTCFPCLEDPILKFKFVYPCGRQLVEVPLPADETLSGLNLHRVYQNKKVYICPSITLDTNIEINNDDSISEPDENTQVYASTSGIRLDQQNADGIDSIITSPTYMSCSDDDDIQQAIRNSLVEEADNSLQGSFYEDLKVMQNKIIKDESTLINVIRGDVLSCVERAFSRKSFSAHKKVNALFVEEEAIDSGGPCREMWRLALEELRNSYILEGPHYSKHLKFYIKDYQNNKYYFAGQVIAMSLAHGGPGPNFFSKTFTSCLLYGVKSEKVTLSIEDIGCNETYKELQKVDESETVEELIENIGNSQYLQAIGTSLFVKHLHEKEKILQGALMHYILHQKREAMEQFATGLETCGVLNLLVKYPNEAYELFCENNGNLLTVEKFNKLFKIEFSEEGTQKRTLEKIIIALWRDYLQLSEDEECKTTLEQILVFATGARKIPPLGFDSTPTINFLHDETLTVFPKANTCALTLHLPVSVTDFSKFKENMEFGIINGGSCFGFS